MEESKIAIMVLLRIIFFHHIGLTCIQAQVGILPRFRTSEINNRSKVCFTGTYNETEPMVELYPFQQCHPGFFGFNCQKRCHCHTTCTCDPIVGCSSCGLNRGCDDLFQGFPQCQCKYTWIQMFSFSSSCKNE